MAELEQQLLLADLDDLNGFLAVQQPPILTFAFTWPTVYTAATADHQDTCDATVHPSSPGQAMPVKRRKSAISKKRRRGIGSDSDDADNDEEEEDDDNVDVDDDSDGTYDGRASGSARGSSGATRKRVKPSLDGGKVTSPKPRRVSDAVLRRYAGTSTEQLCVMLREAEASAEATKHRHRRAIPCPRCELDSTVRNLRSALSASLSAPGPVYASQQHDAASVTTDAPPPSPAAHRERGPKFGLPAAAAAQRVHASTELEDFVAAAPEELLAPQERLLGYDHEDANDDDDGALLLLQYL